MILACPKTVLAFAALTAFTSFTQHTSAAIYTSPAAGTATNKSAAFSVGPLSPGDTLAGTVTNSSTTSTYHLINVANQAQGIYRQRLTFTNLTTTTRAWVRGLNQTASTIGTTDTAIQTANASQNQFVEWYGFGKQEQFYLNVFGTSAAADSTVFELTYSTEQIAPLNLGQLQSGSIQITGTTGPNRKHLYLYDANLNPIAGLQDTDTAQRALSLAATLAPGTYYAATGLANTASNLAAPATSGNRNQPVLDFAGMLVSGSTLGTTTDLNLTFTDSLGAHPIAVPRGGSFDVQFVQFTVVPEPGSSGLACVGASLGLARRRRSIHA